MKKNIVKYIKGIIIIFTIYLLLFLELPFYIKRGGGIIDISERIEIENANIINGSYNMAYVSELKATIPIYLIALMNKNWDIEKKEEIIIENEKNAELRGEIALKEANDTAILVAYKKALKNIKINNTKLIVTYIDENAKTDLQIGDTILEVNDFVIKDKNNFNDIIKNLEIGSKINIKVENNDKIYNRTATIVDIDGNKKIGIVIYNNYDLEINPEIKFNFKKSESGASGGLMMSLAIYDYLTKKDISKGRKIAGTGTIDIDGNIGEIDGVEYKIIGAYKNGADIFFVPAGSNYKDALKTMNNNNLDIELVPVKTFDDALKYLTKE